MKQSVSLLTDIPEITVDKAARIFEAGFKTPEALKAATQEELSLVDGITKLDAKRVYDSLHGETKAPAEAQVAPAPTHPTPAGPPPVPPTEDAGASFRDKLIEFPGISPEVADALLDAGFVSAQVVKSASVEDLTKVQGMTEPLASSLLEHLMGQAASGEAAPSPTTGPSGVRDLERSFSYLVEEDRPETSYNLFISTPKKGMKGYCITRNYPAKIRTKFDLKDVPIVWLSNVGRDNAIRPKDLEKLSLSLEQFLSQPDGGIVLLDGLEYLITNNNFITVLRLIQSLRDQVAINQSILLMAVNRSTLESHPGNL
ncbi:TPA: DUF835 domain-containing protein, partial [Thermoplasmata archaeon]|nr:DUF835 domain-containing protein [Thermoplasmata archaeon]